MLATLTETQNNIDNLIQAVSDGLGWGVTVIVAFTAAFLAVSLIAFLFHRS